AEVTDDHPAAPRTQRHGRARRHQHAAGGRRIPHLPARQDPPTPHRRAPPLVRRQPGRRPARPRTVRRGLRLRPPITAPPPHRPRGRGKEPAPPPNVASRFPTRASRRGPPPRPRIDLFEQHGSGNRSPRRSLPSPQDRPTRQELAMPASHTPPRRKANGVAVRIGAAIGAAAVLAATTACGQTDPDLPEPPSGGDAAPEELTRADVDAWLDDTLPAALEEHGIAGAVVAVVHDGAVVTTRGFGHADTGEGGTDPVEVDPEDTLFRVASISKVFTATAALQLVEQGELDLDTDVSAYIDFELNRSYDEDITLRHLLSHTAGFEERLQGMFAPG